MADPKSTPRVEHRLLPAPKRSAARRQQTLMVVSLALLLGALGLILYRDRDFWFPDTEQAEDLPPQQNPAANNAAIPTSTPPPAAAKTKKAQSHEPKHAREPQNQVATPPEPVVVSARTVLPPLEVEVVAGNAHRAARAGSNSVRVDMQQSGPVARAAAPPPTVELHSDPPIVPTNAADRARVSPASATVVESVRPDYPMLARQMKVQGSVILQALIGRDGLIQDLRVLSGPPILAAAAQEAVRQWHFKPHYLGNAAVETETRITVNFTISTN